MLQKTLWSPDTCGCQIEYEWDDSVSQEDRTHSVSNIVKACSIHNHHAEKENHYADVLNENTSKNKAISLLVASIPKLDGGEKEVKWSFDKNRNIVLSHPLLTDKDKSDLNLIDKSSISKQVTIQ